MTDTSEDVDVAVTGKWGAICKDCRAKRAAGSKGQRATSKTAGGLEQESFDYSDEWSTRTLERGGSRSDRCPECRKTHSQQIRAFPVAYIDITAIGQAAGADAETGPTGPLGGLGPLPETHRRDPVIPVRLTEFKLGLTGNDVLKLLKTLVENQVVILEAGTGTGKSTLAPFRLMNPPPGAVYRPTDFGPIIVTEPRVPATTEVAKFVGEAMCFGHDPKTCTAHVGPGFPVGYQCDGKKVWDDACRLIYVTDGTMINWIKNGDLARFSIVIIDEAHERSENIDTILVLLHQYLPRYPQLKVIIASATIDKSLFVEFFRDVATVGHLPVEAPKSVGYGSPLFAGPDFSTPELDEFLKHGLKVDNPEAPSGPKLIEFDGWKDEISEESDGRNLREATRNLLELRWKQEIDEKKWVKLMPGACAEQAFKLIKAVVAGGIPPGDVLAFLPTETTVLTAKAAFEKKLDGEEWSHGTLVDDGDV